MKCIYENEINNLNICETCYNSLASNESVIINLFINNNSKKTENPYETKQTGFYRRQPQCFGQWKK